MRRDILYDKIPTSAFIPIMKKRRSFIPVSEPDLSGNEEKYLLSCVRSSWISSKGEFIDSFEKSFAEFVGVKHCVLTSSGTSSLHLVLQALGVGKGDEVIVPDLTFIATANTVWYTGATPILVDVEGATWNIDPDKIVEKITKKTKAIIVVHLYGHPADMGRILPIARQHKLHIIEDAAESHGAQVKTKKTWKKVGSIGQAGCFSFYGNKIITTGEGGAVVTSNKKLADSMRMLRDHGQLPGKRYYHEVIGFNYRMTNMQAAVGLAQLERIEEFINKKRQIAAWYTKYLKDVTGITLPQEASWAKSVYWIYSILVHKPYEHTSKQLMEELQKNRIDSRPFFYPLHMLPPYKTRESFSVSNSLFQQGISLPSGTSLTHIDIQRITDVIIKHAS